MSNQKQQDSNFLSDSFFDEPIHDEHNQDSPDFVSNAWNTKLSPVKWKLEFYDAELYLFCQMQQQKCEINDLVQAATVQAITVEFSQSKECLVLWVDEGICWQLGASTRIIKESNFEYNIFIPSDEQLLLLLHHGTPQRLINQFDQELSRICQLDDSGAQIRSEWELVTEVSTPHTEDLVAEIIGRSGRGLAKGIDYSSSALQKNIERVGLFSRHWTWKCSSEEERTTPAPRVVVESVENALWASEWGKDLVTGVADTVTGITAYVSNGVGNNLRATGWFTNDKNKPEWRSIRVARTIGSAWAYSSGQVWESMGKGVESVVMTTCKETTLFLKYKYGKRTGQLAENVCGTLQNCYDATKTFRRLGLKTVATDAIQQTTYDMYQKNNNTNQK